MNPLKDIPFEELKGYCTELGYNLVKRPDLLVPLEPCPICGRKASIGYNMSFEYQIRYSCPKGCLKGGTAYATDTMPRSTKHETTQRARRNWNDAVERWKNENEAKKEHEK